MNLPANIFKKNRSVRGRSSFQRSSLLIAACAISFAVTAPPASAISGAPLAFDQFQVGDVGTPATAGKVAGEITADCVAPAALALAGATISCGNGTVSDGMLQREVYVSGIGSYDGTYVQFIMTESAAQGDATAAPYSTERGSLYFTNEDFIKMNNRGAGLATKQTILDASFDDATNIEQRFANITTYNMGWAQGTGTTDPWVNILQDLTVLQYNDTRDLATSAEELMNQQASIISDGPALDNTKVEIDQRMTLASYGTPSPASDGVQKFKYTRLAGIYTASGYSSTSPPILPGGTNNGIVNWAFGDEIAATWVGFELNDPTTEVTFGFTSFENKSTPVNTANGNMPNFSKRVSLSDPEAGGPAPGCPADSPPVTYVYNSSTGNCDIYVYGGPTGSDTPYSPGGWNSILNPSTLLPLFGTAEAMADVATYGASQLTDYSVKDPVLVSPASANLDYIANSDPTPPPPASAGLVIADSDYNQWTVNTGVFAGVACPGWAVKCSSPVINEGGIYQRWVTATDGEQYLQTILVADATATGDPQAGDFAANSLGFVSETFVKRGAGKGIAGQTHLAQQGGYAPDYTGGYIGANTNFDLPSDGGDFVQNVALNMGWANQGSVFNSTTGRMEPHAAIALDQDLFVPDYLVTNMVPTQEQFTMERGASQADKRITMTSKVGTRETNLYNVFNEPINVRSVTVSGAYQQTARSDFAVTVPYLLPSDTSLDLAWSAGDALQATWIGAAYGVHPLVGMANVSSTSFKNRTTGEAISYTDIDNTPTGPDNWLVDPFLDAPTYP